MKASGLVRNRAMMSDDASHVGVFRSHRSDWAVKTLCLSIWGKWGNRDFGGVNPLSLHLPHIDNQTNYSYRSLELPRPSQTSADGLRLTTWSPGAGWIDGQHDVSSRIPAAPRPVNEPKSPSRTPAEWSNLGAAERTRPIALRLA